MGRGLICWCSKRQSSIALSTMEAEYMALCASTQEVFWIQSLLEEIEYLSSKPATIYEDNQACIGLATNPVHYARSKHIDIKYHFIRDYVNKGDISIVYCPTKEMIADALMKLLLRPAFEEHIKVLELGIRTIHYTMNT